MAKKSNGLPYMSNKKRKQIATKNPSLMGLPKKLKYPLTEDGKTPSPERADAAKKRAGQQKAKGNLTSSQKESIDRKADRILNNYMSNKK